MEPEKVLPGMLVWYYPCEPGASKETDALREAWIVSSMPIKVHDGWRVYLRNGDDKGSMRMASLTHIKERALRPVEDTAGVPGEDGYWTVTENDNKLHAFPHSTAKTVQEMADYWMKHRESLNAKCTAFSIDFRTYPVIFTPSGARVTLGA